MFCFSIDSLQIYHAESCKSKGEGSRKKEEGREEGEEEEGRGSESDSPSSYLYLPSLSSLHSSTKRSSEWIGRRIERGERGGRGIIHPIEYISLPPSLSHSLHSILPVTQTPYNRWIYVCRSEERKRERKRARELRRRK